MSQENNKYTKPELRERIKDRVMAGSKGGKPGQWSARKAQLVAQEYKEAGGGYKGGKGEKQKSLEKWGKENWSTREEYEKGLKAAKVAKKAKQRSAQKNSRS
jgi:UTP:GlnB (protein PII) uridylyltransferase